MKVKNIFVVMAKSRDAENYKHLGIKGYCNPDILYETTDGRWFLRNNGSSESYFQELSKEEAGELLKLNS